MQCLNNKSFTLTSVWRVKLFSGAIKSCIIDKMCFAIVFHKQTKTSFDPAEPCFNLYSFQLYGLPDWQKTHKVIETCTFALHFVNWYSTSSSWSRSWSVSCALFPRVVYCPRTHNPFFFWLPAFHLCVFETSWQVRTNILIPTKYSFLICLLVLDPRRIRQMSTSTTGTHVVCVIEKKTMENK